MATEDNRIKQMLVTAPLTKLSHTVDVVGNGSEAVVAVQSRLYDLVLMDVQTLRMGGVSATEAIRRLDGPIARIPMIALTANAMVGDRKPILAPVGMITLPN